MATVCDAKKNGVTRRDKKYGENGWGNTCRSGIAAHTTRYIGPGYSWAIDLSRAIRSTNWGQLPLKVVPLTL